MGSIVDPKTGLPVIPVNNGQAFVPAIIADMKDYNNANASKADEAKMMQVAEIVSDYVQPYGSYGVVRGFNRLANGKPNQEQTITITIDATANKVTFLIGDFVGYIAASLSPDLWNVSDARISGTGNEFALQRVYAQMARRTWEIRQIVYISGNGTSLAQFPTMKYYAATPDSSIKDLQTVNLAKIRDSYMNQPNTKVIGSNALTGDMRRWTLDDMSGLYFTAAKTDTLTVNLELTASNYGETMIYLQ